MMTGKTVAKPPRCLGGFRHNKLCSNPGDRGLSTPSLALLRLTVLVC